MILAEEGLVTMVIIISLYICLHILLLEVSESFLFDVILPPEYIILSQNKYCACYNYCRSAEHFQVLFIIPKCGNR